MGLESPGERVEVSTTAMRKLIVNEETVASRTHHITSHHITSHRIASHHITSHHIASHHITSHHITSHHITSHHITSHHITSHHITSHHITEEDKLEKRLSGGGNLANVHASNTCVSWWMSAPFFLASADILLLLTLSPSAIDSLEYK